MKAGFNETDSPKLNAVLKTVFYWVVFLVLLFLVGSQVNNMLPAGWDRFAYGILGTLAAFFAVWTMLKIEKRTFADYGLCWQQNTFLKFVKGLFIGTAVFSIIILLLLLFTQYQLTTNPATWNPWSAFWYLSIIPLALMEEVAFRSYPFLKLHKVFGLRITQLIIAVAFALYHIIQGWGFQGAFLGPGIWALVFGLAAVWSKGIALATGIHVALNLIQQLIGLKSDASESILLFALPENISDAATAQAQTWGIITQLLVLAASVICTEIYIRKNNSAEKHV
jgi:membrane protease YdiL (CAAX protease family)